MKPYRWHRKTILAHNSGNYKNKKFNTKIDINISIKSRKCKLFAKLINKWLLSQKKKKNAAEFICIKCNKHLKPISTKILEKRHETLHAWKYATNAFHRQIIW